MHPPVHPVSSGARKRAAAAASEHPAAEEALLQALGERVRDARADLGMTRRSLAQQSGVSERYLALLENGHGNISIVLLLRVAKALDLPIAALLSRRAPGAKTAAQQAELELINAMLLRLPVQKLPAVRIELRNRFGKLLDARKLKSGRIALIGLRGAGKSTLGGQLAATLAMPFIELDREIEREAGTSLSEIFLLYGQEGYRRHEKRCLEQVIDRNERVIIATGGSLVSEAQTFELLLNTCTTVWVKALPEEHMTRVMAQGDTRPMAGNREAMQDLVRILENRSPLYGQADIIIDTGGKAADKSLRELTAAITRQMEEHTT